MPCTNPKVYTQPLRSLSSSKHEEAQVWQALGQSLPMHHKNELLCHILFSVRRPLQFQQRHYVIEIKTVLMVEHALRPVKHSTTLDKNTFWWMHIGCTAPVWEERYWRSQSLRQEYCFTGFFTNCIKKTCHAWQKTNKIQLSSLSKKRVHYANVSSHR